MYVSTKIKIIIQFYKCTKKKPQYFLKEKKKKKSWYNIFQGFFSAKICTCIKSLCFIIKQVTMTCKLKTGNLMYKLQICRFSGF